MGFIGVSLIVAGALLFVNGIINRMKSKAVKNLKKIMCIVSVLAMALFISLVNTIWDTVMILVGVIIFIIYPLSDNDVVQDKAKRFMLLNAIAIVIIGCILGFGHGSGYEENVSEIESIELVECQLSYGEDKYSFYLYEEDNSYNYLKLNSDTNKFEEVKISKNEANIDENANIDKPKLVIYQRHAKQTFWSFGLSKKTEYVFYVSSDMIAKDNN